MPAMEREPRLADLLASAAQRPPPMRPRSPASPGTVRPRWERLKPLLGRLGLPSAHPRRLRTTNGPSSVARKTRPPSPLLEHAFALAQQCTCL